MAGQLTITPSLEQFQEAATKWRPELLMQPIIGCQDTIQHMTPRPGIRYKENVGAISGDAQFGPYKPSRSTDFNLNVKYRTLETYMGSVHCKFEPNSAASTILGYMAATKGDGQMKAPTALHVLTYIAKSLSGNLNDAIWNGERNPSGDTTHDLFDGFDTITQMEIDADEISVANMNYMKLTEEITAANALDVAKEILYSLDPRLNCVEGSNGKLHIIPLFNKADSKFIHVTPKSNMLVGYDQMGDVESVMVKEYEPFILSYIATMFFGVQFESIDYRRLKVIELVD